MTRLDRQPGWRRFLIFWGSAFAGGGIGVSIGVAVTHPGRLMPSAWWYLYLLFWSAATAALYLVFSGARRNREN